MGEEGCADMAYSIYILCDTALSILVFIVIAGALLSWFPISKDNALVRFVYSVTEPLLRPFRFAQIGTVDLSPILLIILINIARSILQALFLRFM